MFFYKFISKLFEIFSYAFFKVEIIGKENIPSTGRCILACNHKSNLDAILIAGLLRDRPINAIAKKELFNNIFLAFILKKLNVIPIDRNKPQISTIKSIIKVLNNEQVLGIFPEGTRHKNSNNLSNAKQGIAMFAIKGKSPIIPISLITNYKFFNKVTIVIDTPIFLDNYYDKKTNSDDYIKISSNVMSIIEKNYNQFSIN